MLRNESDFMKKNSEKMKKQIDRMLKSETTMLKRVLEHDEVLKQVKALEQELFIAQESNKSLEQKIEKLEFENENLMTYKEECEKLKQTIRGKGIEVTDLKLTIKEKERVNETQEMRILDLEERSGEWMSELLQLRARVIELEHVNQINIQNNRLLFNSQRIEFSRMNLGNF